MESLEEVRLAFLFADVCRSTELLVRLGDRRAHRVMSAHRDGVRGVLLAHRGSEVELRGDGCLAVFADAADALRAGLAMGGLPHRVGIHFGRALRDEGKYFGRDVVLAARLCELAGPREILVSQTVYARVGPLGQFVFGPPRPCALRGFGETQRAYAVREKSLNRSADSDRIASDGERVGRLAVGTGVSACG